MSSKEMPVEQARKVLGDLVIAAMHGKTTVLTRYGRPVAQITPYQEPAMTTTRYTHPNHPRVALQATSRGGGEWVREILIDGKVVHSKQWTSPLGGDKDTAGYQASQGGFWVAAWADRNSAADADTRAVADEIAGGLGGLEREIEKLAAHVACGRADERTVEPAMTITVSALAAELDVPVDVILALVDQLVEIDGSEKVVASEDRHSVTLTAEAADTIREQIRGEATESEA